MKWIISIMELSDNGKKYKVTRRVPELEVSETKFFDSQEKAKEKFDEWSKEFLNF